MIFTALICISGCSAVPTDNRISVVCTSFAAYDWACRIVGQDSQSIAVTMLPDSATDIHSYQATAQDIVKIAQCDVLICTAGPSEKWITDAVSQNSAATVLRLSEILGDGLKTVEHSHSAHEKDHEHADAAEYDEHVWLSLKNAELFCENIAAALEKADPENAKKYRKNAQDYIVELALLDGEYELAAKNAEKSALIFADRFPFHYLLDDYGIEYYAAFPGCSSETEAGFDTIIFLAEKADELHIDCLLTIEGSQSGVAQTVAESTAAKSKKILVLDSMQSADLAAASDGKTYLSVMRSNLDIIKTALN